MKYREILNRHKELDQKPLRETADRYCREQRKDGAFRSVAEMYPEKNNDCQVLHCCMIKTLASAFYHYGEDVYRVAAVKGIAYWEKIKFQGASNWFHNSILIPRMLLDTLLLLDGQIEKAQRSYLISEIEGAYTEERYVYDIGANIVWTNMIMLHLACYLKNETLYAQAARRINEEMRFAQQHSPSDKEWRRKHWRKYVGNRIEGDIYEGVQEDYSFFEHGPLLHTGAYGKAYLFSLCQLMYECRGTDVLQESSCRFLIDYLLEHYRWTMTGETQDYNVIGRKIAEKNKQISMESNLTFAQLLRLVEDSGISYRIEEIKETRMRMEEGKSPVSGVQYFPKGKYLVGKSGSLSVAVRMTCRGMLASESVNWENLKCWHLGNGVSYVYTDGKDYDRVFPAYNWEKIPGSTVECRQRPVLDRKQHIAVEGSESVYCGGIAGQNCGAAAMELKKDGLKAKKSWFFLGGEWICLGSDICCSGEGEVITTVNQMKRRGNLWADGIVQEKECSIDGVSWLGHCRAAYIFSGGQKIRVVSGTSKGDWNDIAYDQSPQRPDKPMPQEEEMVTVWLSHGVKPSGGRYEYRILPWEEGEVPEAKVKVLANNEKVQAVALETCMIAVFWERGEFSAGGQIIRASEPCLVICNGEAVHSAKLDIRHQEEKKGENEVRIG